MSISSAYAAYAKYFDYHTPQELKNNAIGAAKDFNQKNYNHGMNLQMIRNCQNISRALLVFFVALK